ncbi:protein PLANT CADMIUM RESISTANCE 7-like [Nicotiana tomentosiformis]|uniref:protein PLANT CADMIUM RESISTANCE 7-like n=1 Tax=Nicotiana tomentosiformis TaxID=4098 RepID=UPI00051C12E7|nr:protein PLANT CADMIUM RESISTANCE 7-like [Nicotiana tomentosiformis]
MYPHIKSNGYDQFASKSLEKSSQPYFYPHLLPYGYGMPPTQQLHPPYRSSGSSVYVQRAPIGITKPMQETTWSTNIFACCRDPKNCLKTCFCPCITSGQIAEIVSEGRTSCMEGVIINFLLCCFCLAAPLYTFYNRVKLRRKFKLEGNGVLDCLTHTLCCYCALCQEYRELHRQGFDPSLGWAENIERQSHAVAVFTVTPPPVQEAMKR